MPSASQFSNPESIAGEPFSPEQKQYLEGFFAGVAQRMPFAGHTADGLITAEPSAGVENLAAAALFHGTPVEDLCREELWKYERNPLDAWDKLLAHTNEDKAPDAEHTIASSFTAFSTSLRRRTRSCYECGFRARCSARARCAAWPRWRRSGVRDAPI